MALDPKAYIPPGVPFALHWQLVPTQMKCRCNTNDSTYILYAFFFYQNEVDLGSCLMVMKTLFLI